MKQAQVYEILTADCDIATLGLRIIAKDNPVKIVTADRVRQIDKECEGIGLPSAVLMENAGKAVAEEVKRILGGVDNRHVVILAGPGNNGGDGLVAARYLHDWGAGTSLFLFKQRPEDDINFKLVKEHDMPFIYITDDEGIEKLDEELSSADAVIDAIFGTGNNRPLGDIFAQALIKVGSAKEKCPDLCIIAVDLPSGLNADTGDVDPACLKVDDTVTLAFPKPGLYNLPGLEYAGNVTITDIGIPAYLAEDVTTQLITAERVQKILPKRPLWANKGTFGRVLVVAGSVNYTGAAYLACSGAIRAGAGLVTLATPASLQPVLAAKLIEATWLPLPESEPGFIFPQAAEIIRAEIDNYNVLLIGCGLGQNEAVIEFVNFLLLEGKAALPQLVIDADALNILAKTPGWWRQLKDNAVLTPHPGEMARLAEISIDKVQADRAGVAGKAAREWGKTVVLKGACTVIASPDGQTEISPVANPGLASAGTGDVLAGVIAGLAAQGLSPAEAAVCGVYLHGQAGEIVREQMGDTGMIASDLLPVLPLAVKHLKENRYEH
ncbi:NAD(P)H-hydrate dehydratase [Chloroflexota bacterium]